MPHLITIDHQLAGISIKQFFRTHYPHLAYPLIQTWLRKGEIKLNGKKIDSAEALAQILSVGDILKLPPPHFMAAPPEKPTVITAAMAHEKLSSIVLAKRDNFLVVNKPAGLAVQGGSGIQQSLDDWLIALNRDNNQQQYKLVHRLDRDTSGLMLIAKHRAAAQDLTLQFHNHLIQKTYLAVVRAMAGLNLPDMVNAPLKPASIAKWEMMTTTDNDDPDGLSAKTHIKKIGQKHNLALLELKPLSGRKHQLRVHLSHLGAPIIGDKKYNDARGDDLPKDFPKKATKHLLLHACRLTLPNGEVFHAPAPDYFPLDYFDKNLV